MRRERASRWESVHEGRNVIGLELLNGKRCRADRLDGRKSFEEDLEKGQNNPKKAVEERVTSCREKGSRTGRPGLLPSPFIPSARIPAHQRRFERSQISQISIRPHRRIIRIMAHAPLARVHGRMNHLFLRNNHGRMQKARKQAFFVLRKHRRM